MAKRGRADASSERDRERTEEKVCASCGRRMQWRAKWANSWSEVKYCSDACRRRGVSAEDERLEAAILELLAQHPRGTTVNPADAAAPAGAATPAGTAADAGAAHVPDTAHPAEAANPGGARAHPDPEAVRRAARRLVQRGLVEMVQRGRVVDPSTARGEIGVRATRGR